MCIATTVQTSCNVVDFSLCVKQGWLTKHFPSVKGRVPFSTQLYRFLQFFYVVERFLSQVCLYTEVKRSVLIQLRSQKRVAVDNNDTSQSSTALQFSKSSRQNLTLSAITRVNGWAGVAAFVSWRGSQTVSQRLSDLLLTAPEVSGQAQQKTLFLESVPSPSRHHRCHPELGLLNSSFIVAAVRRNCPLMLHPYAK